MINLRREIEALEGVLSVTSHRSQGNLTVVVLVDWLDAFLGSRISAISKRYDQRIEVKESPRIRLR